MAKTQHLRRRIRSIRNTMQVTKAMKMVSAARLRRAQERIVTARPFANRMREVLRSVAARANSELHPLLQRREERRVDVVVVAADRGLCGSFNTNILKTAAGFLAELGGREVSLTVVGKKSREYFQRRMRGRIRREWVDVFRKVDFATAQEIAGELIDRYVSGETDAVYLVYNEFKSVIQQRPVVERVLPIEREEFAPKSFRQDYIFEPDAQSLFDRLLPISIKVQVFRSMLESAAAEHAARMTAMDSATSNAQELVESLTLRMNRVRQASITTEIIEVVSGAQALG